MRSLSFRAAMVLTIVFWARIGRAEDAAADPLKEKGLVKQGSLYVSTLEAQILKDMRTLRTLKAKVEDENRQRLKLDNVLKQASTAMAEWEFQRRQLNDKLSTVHDPLSQNQYIGKINELTSKLREGSQFKDDNEKKLHELGADDRSSYINQVVDLSAKMEAAQKAYAELAGDDAVKAAIESAKPKVRLGPSGEMTSAASQLKKWRTDINADSIELTSEGHVWTVQVTLNDKITQSMVVDSGASMVALPATMAAAIGLMPAESDEKLQLTLADGKIVIATKMTLKSVRVGTFTVENVDCAVLPPALDSAPPLLGGTFLNNFIYKVDADAGKLHLAQIVSDKSKKRLGDSAATPKAASGSTAPKDAK